MHFLKYFPGASILTGRLLCIPFLQRVSFVFPTRISPLSDQPIQTDPKYFKYISTKKIPQFMQPFFCLIQNVLGVFQAKFFSQ